MNGDHTEVLAQLNSFFVNTLLNEEQARSLMPDTSLRELGALNSLGMARLVTFIREGLGVEIPLRELTSGNFRTLNQITRLVLSVRETVA